MWVEPQKADPEDIARKRALAPDLKVVPGPTWVLSEDGNSLVSYKMQDLTLIRKARNRLASLLYNMFITYIPSHTVRLGFLRLAGAKIGKGSSIMRTTTILDPEFLRIGTNSTIGMRCLIDARACVWIGDNVTLASDVHVVGGGHDINQPDFLPIPGIPTVICDYAWIASRAMTLPCIIGRGGVVAAHSLVTKDVGECEIVGGVPAKVIGKRDPEALKYSASYRPLFG
ncbi:MAG TPA: acyltransferase [Mycobacterium sp.]|nr:acyltransferase [Mycobacterium sp.]